MNKFTENFKTILIPILEDYEKKFGSAIIHQYFFEILEETKNKFQEMTNDGNGQKWRKESGSMLEQLVLHFILDGVTGLGYEIASDEEIKSASHGILEDVAHNIAIKYGEFFIIPDGDIVIFSPINGDVKAIISCKVSTRERYTQTLYWKLKLSLNERTERIKMYFVTIDKERTENGVGFKKPSLDIIQGRGPTKSRILLEYELDGIYVGRGIAGASHKVKEFDKFLGDLQTALS